MKIGTRRGRSRSSSEEEEEEEGGGWDGGGRDCKQDNTETG